MALNLDYFVTFVPKLTISGMKSKFYIILLATLFSSWQTYAQRYNHAKKKDHVAEYTDSLKASRQRIDSAFVADTGDSRYTQLFTPLTFYHEPAERFLRLSPGGTVQGDSLQASIDRALMNVYLNRPDLVRNHETRLNAVGAPIVSEKAPHVSAPDIVKDVAPEALEPDVVPLGILITKPNFWTVNGDYYLQFLQNYVSDNWYKGGESNYSLLGSVTMQANYNNKQKVKWENKLEMKLGYQTSRGDSIHKYKTTEDLLRYTGKLGLQATKKWYYTLQLIAQTQFTHGLKSNDKFVYSDFFSPFNLNISVGMDYTVDWLNHKLKGSMHFAPLAYNWKYVGREELATRYGLEEGHHSMSDYGSEATIDLSWVIADNIQWKTRLYGYTTYKRAELEWENTITFQFNRYISTNLFLYPRFDDGATRKDDQSYWQFKEYASVGFSYSF